MSVFVDGLAVTQASRKARRNPFRPKPDVVSDEEKQVLAAWASFHGILGR